MKYDVFQLIHFIANLFDDGIQYPNDADLFHRSGLICSAVLRHTMAIHAVPTGSHYSRCSDRPAGPVDSISSRANAMAA